jgi:hypothetical protein
VNVSIAVRKTVCALAAALIGIGSGSADAQGPAGSTSTPTFAKDIAPILQRSCQQCHRPKGVGPMPLVTYADVRPWARAIKQKTSQREMPPWFMEKEIGIQRFKDDISLSDVEIATITDWVDGGTPEGNRADLPAPRQFADAGAWNHGTPDLVVSSPLITVKARAADWYSNDLGSTPTGMTEDRYVKAIEVREFRPGEAKFAREAGSKEGDLNYFVVHHALVSTNPEYTEGLGNEREGDIGYLYEVGQNAQIYPDEVGVKLPAGSTIYFGNSHVHSIGREVNVNIQVGFYFHPKGYTPKYARGLIPAGMSVTDLLDIPAGQDNVRYDLIKTLQEPAKLVSFEPHLHATGKRMCLEVIYPDGTQDTVNCTRYNHQWVKAYFYEDDAAPLLPAGTILHAIAWFNNTASNPRVLEPRNWKGPGARSIDDMCLFLGKLLYLSPDEYKAEVAARAAKQRTSRSTAAGQ